MDNYKDISNKFYEVEGLFKDIRDTKDKIEGTRKLLDDIMHSKSIYKLDIFMDIGEAKTITDCEGVWKEIQQYVVNDLTCKLSELEWKYKTLCKQFTEVVNESTNTTNYTTI